MTLSRGPYNELDKMSLFQDLKLKRRKVDSRCSSDGESLADTSTSSPDLIASISPKICESNQGNPSDTQMQSMQQSSSASSIASATPPPSSSPHNSSDYQGNHIESNSPHFITVRRNLAAAQKNYAENSHGMSEQSLSHNDTKINSISGPHNNGGSSVIIENQRRSQSPTPSSPVMKQHIVGTLLHQQLQQGASNGNKESSNHQHVTVLVTPPKIKTETQHLMNAITRKTTGYPSVLENCAPLSINTPLSGLSQLQQHHQMHQVPQFSSHSMASSQIIRKGEHSSNGNSSPNNSHCPQTTQHMIQQRIKRERSPQHINLPVHPFRQQPTTMPVMNIPCSSSASPVSMHSSSIHSRMTMANNRDAPMMFKLKNEQQQLPIGSFVHQQNAQQRMMWGPNRINGVKPEVIGGPLPSLRQNPSPQTSPQQTSPNHNSNNRTTPTVIMGESCGVRTMVWGFEPVLSPNHSQVQRSTPPNQTPPSTSQNSSQSNSSNSSSNNNEEAAHLLLSLGQGPSRPMMDVSLKISQFFFATFTYFKLFFTFTSESCENSQQVTARIEHGKTLGWRL